MNQVKQPVTLTPGTLYRIRLTSGEWTLGRFTNLKTTNWLRSRAVTHFMFINERTGRTIEIKSRIRIRAIAKILFVC